MFAYFHPLYAPFFYSSFYNIYPFALALISFLLREPALILTSLQPICNDWLMVVACERWMPRYRGRPFRMRATAAPATQPQYRLLCESTSSPGEEDKSNELRG